MVSKDNLRAWILMAIYGVVVSLLLLYFTTPATVPSTVRVAAEESELSEPEAQAVYGGTIRGIDVIAAGTTESKVFITTESANSMFYADVDHSGTSPYIDVFTVVPDLDDEGGFGTITAFDVDEDSGWVYFVGQSGSAHPMGLHRCSTDEDSLQSVQSGNVAAPTAVEGRLFFVLNQTSLYFGTVDSSTGAFTAGTGAPITIPSMSSPSMVRNPNSNYLYILDSSATPKLYKSSTTYDAFSSSTTLTQMTTPAGSWTILGCGPDGRIFLGGLQSNAPTSCYSDNDGTTWSTPVQVAPSGALGPNIDCVGTASSYQMYWATKMSAHKGDSWTGFPTQESDTHPNDGCIKGDPNNSKVVYMTTDGGIGVSIDGCTTVFEINEGVEAVQVKDFVVDDSNSGGWAVGKTGVYHVTDLQTEPAWSDPMRPQREGSTFYSAGMDTSDPTGATAYAGSSRVYKTTDAGANGDQSSWTTVRKSLSESAPNGEPLTPYTTAPSYYVSAIALDPDNASCVFVGYNVEGTSSGELYLSEDAGQTWSQVPVVTARPSPDTSYTGDVDINDILITEESGTRVIYVGVSYSASGGVHRITGSKAAGWDVDHDLNANVTITDLAIDSDGNLYACGTSQSGSQYQPAVYEKESGGSWTALTTTGLTLTGGAQTGAVTAGPGLEDSALEIPYVAYGKYIYYLPVDASSWMLGYEYPEGTIINVITGSMVSAAGGASTATTAASDDASIYVGTGTGLYTQVIGAAEEQPEEQGDSEVTVPVPAGSSTVQIRGLSADLSQYDTDVGEVEVEIVVDIVDAPNGASLYARIYADASGLTVDNNSLESLFRLTAEEGDFELDDIAFIVLVDKENLTSDNMGQAIITLKVGKAWADKYGTDNIRILRVGHGDTREILSTQFKGYTDDGKQATFEATSPHGLSYVGLAALRGSSGAVPISLIVGGIAGGLIIIGILTFFVLRVLRGPAPA